MAEPVNIEGIRTLAKKFREWEAPFKKFGDPNGLWFGASATMLERTADELEMLRKQRVEPKAQ